MDRWKLMNKSAETTEIPGHDARPAHGRVLILGARRETIRLARYLSQRPWSDLPVVGFVDAGRVGGPYAGPKRRGRQLAVHPQTDPVPILGGVDRLAEMIRRTGATDLLVALSGRRASRLGRQLAHQYASSVRIHWVTDESHRSESFRDRRGRSVPPLPWSLRWARRAKRAVDFLVALVLLVTLAPLFAVVAVAILITSGRPIFYTQERVGQGGRRFHIWKFRSMREDAEGETGPIWASDHDSRCTPVGDWLRRTNIDELPQLVNVLRGEMSLVGPRPERPVFVEGFRAAMPDYDLRHAVPVGMTGWAQVHGWRGRTSLRKRIQYDLDYIRRWSFLLDVRILFMTIQHIAWGRTTWGSSPRRTSR